MRILPLAGVAASVLVLTGCIMPPQIQAGAPEVTAAPAQTPDETQEQPEPSAEPVVETPEPPAEPDGTRTNPFPAGTPLVSADWEGVVGATNLNANAAIAEANMFNEPAPDGFVYIAVPITATYTGADEANSMEITLEYVTAAGEVVDAFTYDSFVSADDSNPNQDLFTGGTVSFNEYLLVPSAGVEQGLIRATFGWINGAEGFVTLQ